MSSLFAPSEKAFLVKHMPMNVRDPITVKEVANQEAEEFRQLEVKGLTFNYGDSRNGISNVSFSLKAGSFTVITGKVGSGKTTILRALLGHIPLEEGQVLWNGRLVEDLVMHFVPPRCAYTPQVPVLFDETLRDNIQLGQMEDTNALQKALHLSVLEEDLTRMPEGIDTSAGTGGGSLSGGQLQRTAIARMLFKQVDLYVMDDITSAIDSKTERELWRRLREGESRTVLTASHKKECLLMADHIIVLKAGRIVSEGVLSDLLVHCDEMKKLWGSTLQS